MLNYKKIIKITLISLISLVVLGIISIALLVIFVNPNRFKPMIIAAVNDATGRSLTLDGNISWTIYPNLGLKIQQVSLSNPPQFKNTNFLTIKSADVAVALIPLLNHKIIFKNLALDGLQLDLLKHGNINNWTFNPAQSPQAAAGQANESGAINVELHSLSLTNSSITYTDMDTKSTYASKNFNFNVDTGFGGGIKVDSAEDLVELHKVTFNYNDQAIGQLNLQINNLDSVIPGSNRDPHVEIAGYTYTGDIKITKLSLNQLLHSHGIGTSSSLPLLNNIRFSSKVNGDKNTLKLNDFNFNLNDTLKGNTTLTLHNFAAPTFYGNIAIPDFAVNSLLPQLGEPIIDIPNKKLLQHVSFKTDFTGSRNNLKLGNLHLNNETSSLTGNINVTAFKPLAINENLAIDHINAADYSNLNDFQVPLQQIHLRGASAFTNNGINGTQNLQIANITLLGFSFDQQIRSMDSILNRGSDPRAGLITQLGSAGDINQKIAKIQANLAYATAPGPKDLNLKTNLGSLSTTQALHNSIASPSGFTLQGQSLKMNGNGTLNLKQKILAYHVNTRIAVKGVNPVFNSLNFPADIHGTFANPHATLAWSSIVQQLIAYSINQNKNAIIHAISGQINNVVGKQIPQLGNSGAKVIDNVSKTAADALGNIFGNGK